MSFCFLSLFVSTRQAEIAHFLLYTPLSTCPLPLAVFWCFLYVAGCSHGLCVFFSLFLPEREACPCPVRPPMCVHRFRRALICPGSLDFELKGTLCGPGPVSLETSSQGRVWRRGFVASGSCTAPLWLGLASPAPRPPGCLAFLRGFGGDSRLPAICAAALVLAGRPCPFVVVTGSFS